MVKVVNVRNLDPDAYNVYIGRDSQLSKKLLEENPSLINGTELGNRVRVSEECSREDSIEAHRHFFLENTGTFVNILDTLENVARHRTVCLVCWCKPKLCHGDVIAEHLNKRVFGIVPDIESENIFD